MARKKTWAIVAVIVVAQCVLLAVWLDARGDSSVTITDRTPPTMVSQRFASLVVAPRVGPDRDLAAATRPTIVHFWATWCPPCEAELPTLLQRAAESDIEMVAVSLDPTWEAVDRNEAARASASVVLGDAKHARALGVDQLPATLLVEPGGHITLRVDGARDWSNDAFFAQWRGSRTD